MSPRRKPDLHLVAEPVDFTFEVRRALSAAAAKHIGDDLRAEILRRDFGAVHIRGDRAPVLHLPTNWKAPR